MARGREALRRGAVIFRPLLRRALAAALLLVAVAVAAAALVALAPGDAAGDLAEGLGRGAARAAGSSAIPSAWAWLAGLAHGELGTSTRFGRPVAELLRDRVPRTLALTVSAALLQLALGGACGVLLALRRGGALDAFTSTMLFVLDALPAFWLGVMLLLFLAVRADLFPVSGWTSFTFETRGLGTTLADRLHHLVLPAAALALGGAAAIARFVRGGVIDGLASPVVRLARAQGVAEPRIVVRHAVRPALVPLVTLLGLSLPHLVGGAVLVEQVFNWQGVGMLVTEAAATRDVPVLMGTTLLFAALVVAGSTLADVVHLGIDPRVRRAAR